MSFPKGNIASVGMGVCAQHVPPLPFVVSWPAGAATVFVEGMPGLTMASVGVASCGCSATPTKVSTLVFMEGMGAHRMGDMGMTPGGVYTVTTGAATVFAGG